MAGNIDENKKAKKTSHIGLHIAILVAYVSFAALLVYTLYASIRPVQNSQDDLRRLQKKSWDDVDDIASSTSSYFPSSTSEPSSPSSPSSSTSSSSLTSPAPSSTDTISSTDDFTFSSTTDDWSSSSPLPSSSLPSSTSFPTSAGSSTVSTESSPSSTSSNLSSSTSTTSSSTLSSTSDTATRSTSSTSSSTSTSSFSTLSLPPSTPFPSSSGITSTVDFSSSYQTPSSSSSTGFFSTKTTKSKTTSITGIPGIAQSILSTLNALFTTSPLPSLDRHSTTWGDKKTSNPSGKSRPATPSLSSGDLSRTAAQEYFNSVSMSLGTSKPAAQGKARTEAPPGTATPSGSTGTRPTKPKFTTADAGPCFREPYAISNVCSSERLKEAGVPLDHNVTIEDISAMIFDHNVLVSLQQQCAPSVWCLSQDLSAAGEEYTRYCELFCMLDVPDQCLDQKRRFALATLGLLCEGHKRNVSDTCQQALRKNAHVALSDVYRQRYGDGQAVCAGEEMQKSCNGSCHQMAGNLHCMCGACDHRHMDMFALYDPWNWFFRNDSSSPDQMLQCRVDPDTVDCSLFRDRRMRGWWAQLMKENTFLEAVREMDAAIISGLVTSFLITTLGVVAIVYACVRRTTFLRNPLKRLYTRDDVEYTEIKNGHIDVFDDDLDA